MTKGFRFSLQRLLDLAEQKEALAKLELSKAQLLLSLEQERLQELYLTVNGTRRKVLGLHQRGTSVAQLRLLNSYLRALSEDIHRQAEVVDQQAEVVSRHRSRAISLGQEREKYARLRQKRYDAYRQKALKDQQKYLDDIPASAGGRSHAW